MSISDNHKRYRRERKREEGVIRLARPVKKGLLRLLFSRFLLFFLLIVIQAALFGVTVYGWINDWGPYASAVFFVFTVVMILYLFNSDMDSSAKLTWMLIISVVPVMGAALLLFINIDLGHRTIKRRSGELIARTLHAVPQDEAVLRALETDGSGTEDLVRYVNRSGCFPISDDTSVTYFPGGEEKFEAMLEELRKAKEYICLEYFIIEEGFMWGSVLEILIEKAREGVDVRVLYDGMCEIAQLPGGYAKLLEKQGISAKVFSPLRPIVSTHYNYRDHRKILVIDGRVAFNGGVNLADEYINRVDRFGHWKDAAVMLKGSAAQAFCLMFLQMWNLDEQEPEFQAYLLPGGAPSGNAPRIASGATREEAAGGEMGYVMPYGDNPLDAEKVGETVYMDIMYRAVDYVHIMTPYLILDGELLAALKYAAERGVDVKIILPGIPDKKAAYALAKSHYRALFDAGVKLYEYIPGFVHAKVFTSDDKKAVVGTINLDYRSLYHHFECATYLYKVPCIPEIEKDFQATLAKCRPVTKEMIDREKLSYRIPGHLLKLVAPLM